MKYTISVIILAICLLPVASVQGYSLYLTTYLKDGHEINGNKVYTVDYVNSTGDRYEVADNSKTVTISGTDVINDFTYKKPDSTGYSLIPIHQPMSIVHVQPLSDQLNKYTLSEPIDFHSIITLTETSLTTAIMNYTLPL